MQWEEYTTRSFTHIDQMTEISERVSFWYDSLISGKHRDFFFGKFIFFISDFHISIAWKNLTVSSDPSRQDTVKHIDSTSNPLNYIFRSSYTHEIMGLLFRKMWSKYIEHMVHIYLRLSDRKSTNSHSRSIQSLHKLGWFFTKIRKNNSLNNRKKGLWCESFLFSYLLIFEPLFFWSSCPSVCSFHCCTSIFMGRSTRSTLIKGHDYICPKCTLHIEYIFRWKKMLRSIEIGTKFYSFFCDFRKFFSGFILHTEPKRKYLKTSRICQNRKWNIHKFMKSSERFNHITSRTQIAMIVIHKHNLWTDFLDLIDRDSFHSRAGSYWHKNRGFYFSMRCGKFSCTSESISFFKSIGKSSMHNK